MARLAAAMVLGCAVVGCNRSEPPSSSHSSLVPIPAAPSSVGASAPATSSPTPTSAATYVPWQPHGLRLPTLRCELDAPAGWTRSDHPMPDHLAELFAAELTVIVEERVEPDLAPARERVLAYERSRLLRSKGARLVTDTALEGARAPGHMLSLRFGEAGRGHVETVVLLAFPGLPLVGVVARHNEGDAMASENVAAFVRSLRCATK